MPTSRLFSLMLILCVAAVLGGCNGKTKKIPNGGKTEPIKSNQELLVAELTKRKAVDSGQATLVQDFLAALRKGKHADAERMLSPFALNEVKAQHGTTAQYAEAFKKHEAKSGPVVPFAAFPHPYKHQFDQGNHLIFTMGQGEKAPKIAFYLELSSGVWKIDNILTAGTHRIPESAPALGMTIPQPAMAFYTYYHGANLNEHPPTWAQLQARESGAKVPYNPFVGQPLDLKERLAYLRQCSSTNYLAAIKQASRNNDIIGFLETGRKELSINFHPPELVEHSGDATEVHMRLRPRKSRGREMVYKKTRTVRRHGQWQMDKELP